MGRTLLSPDNVEGEPHAIDVGAMDLVLKLLQEDVESMRGVLKGCENGDVVSGGYGDLCVITLRSRLAQFHKVISR